MRKIEELTLEELKAAAGEEHADFMDEKAKGMLELVKKHETEQDYWFVKYYLAQSFAVFTMGAMAANINESAWIKPDQEISDSMKKSIKGMLGSTLSKDLWAIFKNKEELAIRLFGYGTHIVQIEMEKIRLEEERKKKERSDWTYVVYHLKNDGSGNYYGGASFTKSEKDANRLYDKMDRKKGMFLMMMHMSPSLLPKVENISNPEEFLLVAAKHKEHCVMIRFNEEVMDFLNRK